MACSIMQKTAAASGVALHFLTLSMSGCLTGLPPCMATLQATSCIGSCLFVQCQTKMKHASTQTQSCQTDVQHVGKALKVSYQAYTPAMQTLAGGDIPCGGFCACVQNKRIAGASVPLVCKTRHLNTAGPETWNKSISLMRLRLTQSLWHLMMVSYSSHVGCTSSTTTAGAHVAGVWSGRKGRSPVSIL